MIYKDKSLLSKEKEELLEILKSRFYKNINRHQGLEWDKIRKKLEENTIHLWSLNEMEKTGGEPDVIEFNEKTNQYTFCDCSKESPLGRRSLCYDDEALNSRKKNKPKNSVINTANAMGIELLSEKGYRKLQTLGKFDMKSSSWVQTPSEIRMLGGAIFCDFRYNKVFVYHNSADSYYQSRGFRGILKV